MISISKIKKLRRMSRREIAHRFLEAKQIRLERRKWQAGKTHSDCDLSKLAERLCKNAVQLCPGAEGITAEPALGSRGAIADGHVYLLGCDFDLTRPIDWHTDPRTGYRWPNEFYGDLHLYAHGDGTDIKYPWEIARHQYFVDLALHWRRYGNESDAKLVRSIWLDWIGANPLYQGVHWTSALEPAMRAISWIWTLAVLSDWSVWQASELQTITASMIDHAVYLHDHFSYFSSPYNHVIGEATGLYLLAVMLDEHPMAPAWMQRAVDVLEEYTPNQFYADGFSVEQATSYHFYTLGFLTLAIDAARKVGRPLANIEPLARSAFASGLKFRKPDGTWPAIGDLDSARAMPIQPAEFWDFDSVCQCGAVLFEDVSLLPPCEQVGTEVKMLFGPEAAAWIDNSRSKIETKGDSAHNCYHLEQSGYVIASDHSDWMLFDAGPIAGGLFQDSTPSTAHGHADMLQLLYFADGQSILDDSGIPFYNGNEEWIRHFRSPLAHNTLEIEDAEYVHSEGNLAWSREVARPRLTSEFSVDAWMCSGTVQWKGVICQRHVLAIPQQGLWIADWLQSEMPRKVKWHWQLPLEVEESQDAGSLVCWGNYSITRHEEESSASAKLLLSGREPQGLRYHRYGERSQGTTLTYEQSIQSECLVLTSIGRTNRPEMTVNLKDRHLTACNTRNRRVIRSWTHHSCEWQEHGAPCPADETVPAS